MPPLPPLTLPVHGLAERIAPAQSGKVNRLTVRILKDRSAGHMTHPARLVLSGRMADVHAELTRLCLSESNH